MRPPSLSKFLLQHLRLKSLFDIVENQMYYTKFLAPYMSKNYVLQIIM